MLKVIIIIMLIMCLISCTLGSKSIRTSIEYGAKGIACVAIGNVACVSLVMVDGFLEGAEQETKDKIARTNEKLIKAMADKQAKDNGIELKECWLFGLICS